VEYWVVDLVHKTVHVFADPNRRAGRYLSEHLVPVKKIGSKPELAPAAYPDVRTDLRPVFHPGPIDA
jgi:hypothetical protein